MEQREGLSDGTPPSKAPMGNGEKFIPRWGSLDEVGAFDAKRWGMSESEARSLDPQVSDLHFFHSIFVIG